MTTSAPKRDKHNFFELFILKKKIMGKWQSPELRDSHWYSGTRDTDLGFYHLCLFFCDPASLEDENTGE